MKKFLFVLTLVLIGAAAVAIYLLNSYQVITTPLGKKVEEITEKPLAKYSFLRLKETDIEKSPLYIGNKLHDDEAFASYEFSYCVDKRYITDPVATEICPSGGRVTGLINIPKETGSYPVIVMYRGFVARESFSTGEGTRRTAEEFARNGFITLAPDFLGYGGSDPGSDSSMEDRLQTYPTALTLQLSIPNLTQTFAGFESQQSDVVEDERITGVLPDVEKVGIWGHSNGGHIALSVLAITGQPIPTVLWNPVTKPFPYSILYFTDEYEDEGRALRKVVSDFESEYDVFEYSPAKYYGWIEAPIELHQAVNDEAVPIRWSDQFVDSMNTLEKDIEYFTYPGENHNFNLGSWDRAVSRNIDFYTEAFE